MGRLAGIDDIRAEVLPSQKADHVKQLQDEGKAAAFTRAIVTAGQARWWPWSATA